MQRYVVITTWRSTHVLMDKGEEDSLIVIATVIYAEICKDTRGRIDTHNDGCKYIDDQGDKTEDQDRIVATLINLLHLLSPAICILYELRSD